MSDKISITLYPEDGPEKALRTIGLGIKPLIILEVEPIENPDEEGDVDFTFTGSWIESPEQLLEMIESFAEILKDAIDQLGEEGSND